MSIFARNGLKQLDKMRKIYQSIMIATVAVAMSSCANKDQAKPVENAQGPIKPAEQELVVDTTAIAEKDAAYLFYNEFTVAGQPLKIKGGEYAKGAKVSVLFNDGNGFNLASPKVEVKGNNEIWAVVPENVANSFPVMIVNGSDSIKTDVLFRDARNIIVDFDNKKDQLYISGAAEKYANLFSLNTGDYGVFDDIKSWQAIVYQSARENAKAADSTVFGSFTNDILNKQLNIREFAIKFEVNVPKDHPIIGEVFEFGFCSGNDEDPIGNIRNCAAYWCPSEYVWIKETDSWEIDNAKPFYTDGWMTVTIPFSELLWKSKNMSICADASHNGQYTNGAWTDYKHHYNYAQLHADPTEVERWGGFTINVNEYGSCLRREKYKVAMDNIRIVPNDGAGALYLKKDYGVPQRHYSKK
jgi:hypothetical protein